MIVWVCAVDRLRLDNERALVEVATLKDCTSTQAREMGESPTHVLPFSGPRFDGIAATCRGGIQGLRWSVWFV